MNDEILQAARIVWEWLPVCDKPKVSDFIFVLCNASNRLPDVAAKLFNDGLAQLLAISGGYGRLTKNDTQTEASRYKTALLKAGVPETAIIIEDQSTSTGENILYTQQKLQALNITVRTGLAVTPPLMSRRHRASLRKQWADVDWRIITSPLVSFDDRVKQTDFDHFVHLIVGEVERISIYPSKGFMVPETIPKEVLMARDLLCTNGYTNHLPA